MSALFLLLSNARQAVDDSDRASEFKELYIAIDLLRECVLI
jgi:hypothetical protein